MVNPREPQVGCFRFTTAEGRWWWSDEMFAIHGMEPGEVVPTLAVLERHVHPDDRSTLASLTDHVHVGKPFGCQYRLLQLDGTKRVVTITASPEAAGDQVSGVLVDVTEAHQGLVAQRVNDELSQALRSHTTIDQAKGVFMLGYGIDEHAAFELLRWSSQQRNVRLVTLAERLLAAVSSSGGVGPETRHRLDDFFFSSLFDEAPPTPPSTSSLTTSFVVASDVPTLRVAGPVDLTTAGELSTALAELVRRSRDVGTMVVDLRAVTHLGPAGVAALSSAHRRSLANGVRMRVVLGDEARLRMAAHGLDVLHDTSPARSQ